MRIAVDLDGVLYEFQRTYRYMIREYRAVWMPPVEDFWYQWDAFHQYGDHSDHAWMWNKGVEKGLFRYGHMVRGARRALERISKMHDIVIVTHRPVNATSDTVDWLSLFMKDIPYGFVILSDGEPKTTVQWDLLIDDKPENVQDALDAGRKAVLFDQPWNSAYYPGMVRMYGWEGVGRVV